MQSLRASVQLLLSRNSQATAMANAPTQRVSYNNAADLARGVCGYEGCKHKNEPADPDSTKVIISCEPHSVTHSVALRYMTELECQSKHNGEVELAERFSTSHDCIHRKDEKECSEGHVRRCRDHYQECSKLFGAYSLSETLECLSSAHSHKPCHPQKHTTSIPT